MTTRFFLLPSLLLTLACGDDSGDTGQDSAPLEKRTLVQSLTESMQFDQADIVQKLLPDPSGTMRLQSLGDEQTVQPDADGMMSLKIDSQPDQDAIATLLQFSIPGEEVSEGEGSHIVVPVPEDQRGSTLIENEYSVDTALCEDICDDIFEVEVKQALEFEDGEISLPVTSTLIVDCAEMGDPERCSDDDPPALDTCGDASEAELVYTRRREIDSHFSAARQLARAVDRLDNDLQEVLDELASGLELDASAADGISDASSMRVADHTADGLEMLLGEQGCAVASRAVSRALDQCDTDRPDLSSVPCEGECRVRASECSDGAEERCKGLLEQGSCDGSCTGSCTVTLSEDGPCMGTCIGSCSGECPAGEDEPCDGPCAGDCSGECREPLSDSCDGVCSGLCDEAGAGECADDLAKTCVTSAPGECQGLCFGVASLEEGSELCKPAALAIARARVFCEPALVQLSFGFADGLDADAQADFAAWVSDLNGPLVELFQVLAVADRLARAGGELEQAHTDHLEDTVDALLNDDPEDEALQCAQDQLSGMATRMMEDLSRLGRAQDDGMMILSDF